MAKKADREHSEALLTEMRNILSQSLKDVATDVNWKQAFVDIRRPPKSTTRISKLRVVLSDGTTTPLLDTPLKYTPKTILSLFDELWKTKDKAFTEKWYGLKITVYPEGKSELLFNPDPKCAEDPTFFDD